MLLFSLITYAFSYNIISNLCINNLNDLNNYNKIKINLLDNNNETNNELYDSMNKRINEEISKKITNRINQETNKNFNKIINNDIDKEFNKFIDEKIENSGYSFDKFMQNVNNLSFKDLKLLNSIAISEWAKNWIYEMTHEPSYYPTFMYQDMFRIRDFANENNSKRYFYIGYFPDDINLKRGPYYIGAFELNVKKKEFITYLIIQNPFYNIEIITDNKNDDDNDNIYNNDESYEKIIKFKKELINMSKMAGVSLVFNDLNNDKDLRYYYSWLYEN